MCRVGFEMDATNSRPRAQATRFRTGKPVRAKGQPARTKCFGIRVWKKINGRKKLIKKGPSCTRMGKRPLAAPFAWSVQKSNLPALRRENNPRNGRLHAVVSLQSSFRSTMAHRPRSGPNETCRNWKSAETPDPSATQAHPDGPCRP